MIDIFYLLFSIAAPLFVLLVPKGYLTVKIVEASSGKKLSLGGMLNAYVPYYNSYKIRKTLYGYSPVYGIINIVAIITYVILLVVRLVTPYLPFVSELHTLVQTVMTMWFLVFLVVTYIFEVYLLIDLYRMLDKKKLIIFSLLPPVGSGILAVSVAPYFKKYRAKIDGTFVGNSPQ